MCRLIAILLLILSSSCARPKKESFSRTAIKPKALPLVILDPGHGGANDGTKMCIAPYTPEKKLALETALKVRDILEQWGYRVKMTRTRDVFIPLHDRVSFAKQNKGYIFVSIHYNHAPNKNAQGIEVFYCDKSRHAARAKQLGTSILDSMCKKLKATNRGVHAQSFHVVRENDMMPAVLIEGGFFSNIQEARKLSDPQYVRLLSYSIAQGIDDFIERERAL